MHSMQLKLKIYSIFLHNNIKKGGPKKDVKNINFRTMEEGESYWRRATQVNNGVCPNHFMGLCFGREKKAKKTKKQEEKWRT